MANPNFTDMTDEDAADLQFPKGVNIVLINRYIEIFNLTFTLFIVNLTIK